MSVAYASKMPLAFRLILACVLCIKSSATSCELTIHIEFNKCLGMGFHANDCMASVERVAACIDIANRACGEDHVIRDILSGQRVRDAGPYICNNIQNFVLSATCLRNTGVLLDTCQFEYVWGKSCPASGLSSTSERLCYFYDRTVDCYEQHTGSCGDEYIKTVRKFFPSNCGGTGGSVSDLRHFISVSSSEFNDDMCVYKVMRRFQVCLQTQQTGSCNAWVDDVARCIETSNTCGDDHLIAQVLNGQRFRNAGPSICENQQTISASGSCLRTTGVLLQTCAFTPLWDNACHVRDVSSMADRVCLSLYDKVLDCYHQNTGSCGYAYINWLRGIFPNNCGGTGGKVTGLHFYSNTAQQNSFNTAILILAATLYELILAV